MMTALRTHSGEIVDTSDDRLAMVKDLDTGQAFVVRLGLFEGYRGTTADAAGIVSGRGVDVCLEEDGRVASVSLK